MVVRRRPTDRLRKLFLLLTLVTLGYLLLESFLWPILPPRDQSSQSVVDQAYTALHNVRETKAYIRGTKIPKIIHQTWSTKTPSKQPHHVRTSLYNWRFKNPDFHYLLWTDEDMDAFVQVLFPETYEWYSLLPKIVMKADLFRLLVLKTFGGIVCCPDVFASAWNCLISYAGIVHGCRHTLSHSTRSLARQ